MYTSAPEQRDTSYSSDVVLVPEPVSHLKSLLEKADRESLYQVIVLGGSFIEGLGLLWFRKALGEKKVEFQWKDTHPGMGMRHVIALLNSIGLIDNNEYGAFQRAVDNRNQVVHHMYSKWGISEDKLKGMADLTIECVERIAANLRPPKSE